MIFTGIEFQGQQVFLTASLANYFGTSDKVLNRNFQRNKQWYEEGEHYFHLSGETLDLYKKRNDLCEVLKYFSSCKLWTIKGVWLHAKSLQTEKAWRVYQNLFDYHSGDKASFQEPSENLHSGELKRLRQAVSERVYKLTPGETGARPLVFRLLYTALQEKFIVESYKDIPRESMQDALRFIYFWASEIEINRSDYYEFID